MSQATLRSVAIEHVDKFNATGQQLLQLWQTGAERLIKAPAALPALPFVSESVRANWGSMRDKVSDALSQRLHNDVARVGQLMDSVAERTSGGIDSVAAAAQRVESEPSASLLRTWHDLHLPLAQLSLKVADRVARGAGALNARAAGSAAADEQAPEAKSPRRVRTRAAKS